MIMHGKLEHLSGIFTLTISIQVEHLSEATTEKGN